jgi:outer membrane protein assembly factor BamB
MLCPKTAPSGWEQGKRRTASMWGVGLGLLLLAFFAGAACTPGFALRGWSGLTGEDDLLYVGLGEGRLLAVSVQDFAQAWGFPPQGQRALGVVYSAPLVTRDAVYLAVSNGPKTGRLYAIQKDGGAQDWLFPPSGFPHPVGALVGRPVAAGDLLLIGSSDGILYALDRKNGDLRWEFATADRIWSTPTAVDDVAYFGSLDHGVYAVSVADGKLLWRFPADGAITGTPLVARGRVYIGSLARTFYALDADSGKAVWQRPLDGWAWADPITDGQALYVATLGGTLYALDPATGKERWSTSASGPILLPPVFLPGFLAVATEERLVHILSLERGVERRRCSLDVRVRAPMVSQGDLVYLVDTKQNVRELNTRSCTTRTLAQPKGQ